MKRETVKNLSIVGIILLVGMVLMWVVLEAPQAVRLVVGGIVFGVVLTAGSAVWISDRQRRGTGGGDSTG